MTALSQLNLAVRFLLELAVLGALGWAALRLVDGPMRILAAIAAVLITAALWGTLVAPRAPVRLPLPGQLAVEATIFGAAVAALTAIDLLPLAVALGAAAFVNRTIMLLRDQ